MVATFTPALNKIQQTAPDAVTLLQILCFCDPEGIPMSIFTQGCKALELENEDGSSEAQVADKLKTVEDLFKPRIRLSKAVQEVQRLSLAAQVFEGTDRIIRIHDLVHLLLRSKLMTNTERGQWLEIAITIVCKAFEEIDDHRSPQNWSRCGRFISHIESLESFAEQYRIDNHKILDASMWAAVYLDECGLYEKAASLNKRTLERKQQILGKEHPDTLASMNNLALVLKRQGKYEEAEKIQRQTLASKESVLGKEHPETLTSMNNLAMVLHSQKKYEEAEKMQRQTLALKGSVLGKEHPETLMSMNNLALVLDSQGKYEEAEKMQRQTLALRESVLGKEHPNSLASMGGLAKIYWNQDRWKETERLEVQVMEIRKKILGAEHPDTMASMHDLAFTWKSQSRNKEAISLMRDCAELRNQILGPEHPDTETSFESLGRWESEDDKLVEEEEEEEEEEEGNKC